MSLFSQRKALKPLQKEFQRETVDDELKNRLWSALKIVVWDKNSGSSSYSADVSRIDVLLDRIWLHFFKFPVDTRPSFRGSYYNEKNSYQIIREFFFNAQWYEIYDFIEFVIKNIPQGWASDLRDFCNHLLEDENAAYRILEHEVVEITDKVEIEAIEDALDLSIQPVTLHLRRSLELLSDKNEPDYRNSIKESISAVEACCQYITGSSNAALGDALKRVNASLAIHPALEKGLSAIYGYTSDSGGIRHAFIDGDQSPSYADAKFMLVACSGFVNFLLTKIAESNTKA